MLPLEARWEEYKTSCASGNAEACHSLGEYYQLVRNDAAAALALFARNCDPPEAGVKRFAPSCFAMAAVLSQQRGREAEAPAYFDKACAAGFAEGCFNMGVIVSAGRYGVSADAQRARGYYDRACATGVGRACLTLGVEALQRGNDNASALHHFEKACLLGELYGCVNATVMLRKGAPGVAVDAERAAVMQGMAESTAKQMGVTVRN